jgi:hypothetical protein
MEKQGDQEPAVQRKQPPRGVNSRCSSNCRASYNRSVNSSLGLQAQKADEVEQDEVEKEEAGS